jgi:hypothetical protein
MPEVQQNKQLFDGADDLDSAVLRTRERRSRPRRTGVGTFRITAKTRDAIRDAARRHGIDQSALVRDALNFRLKQLLNMARIIGRHEFIQSDDEYELERQRELHVKACYRLDFSTSDRIGEARERHNVRFEIQIVRPALLAYAQALLKLPKVKLN